MSIEKKQPTQEFYEALDDVITHQIKSREAFDKAIEIGRKQGYDDFTISLFIKDYLKEKIPRTSLYRYLKEITSDTVPMEQIYYNNVLDLKYQSVQECLANAVKKFNELKRVIIEVAEMLAEKIDKKIDLEVQDKRYDEKKFLNDIIVVFHDVERTIIKAADILEKEGNSKEKIIAEIKRSYIKLCADEPDMKHIDTDISFIDDFLHSHYKDKK